mmetsp:Transcript_32891/g.29774  ORF Transcript_32891/g.29774 Transcript_32891/m.29774 type:complete len:84 (-) Transcript_32891:658-909(-)
MHLMKKLEAVDVNLICLAEIKKPDMIEIFEDIINSIHRLKGLQKFCMTGDNECFEFGEMWTGCQEYLRKKYPTRIIEVALVTT